MLQYLHQFPQLISDGTTDVDQHYKISGLADVGFYIESRNADNVTVTVSLGFAEGETAQVHEEVVANDKVAILVDVRGFSVMRVQVVHTDTGDGLVKAGPNKLY